MNLRRLCSDVGGTSAVEFAMTAPVLFVILLAVCEFGLLMWTQLGLQHGAEMAARCATFNSGTCGSTTAIQNYAVQNAFGLSIPASTFSVTTPACGNQVSATYSFHFIVGYFGTSAVTLNAQSCFPK
jgi:Flp pilus assembly protein TadG